MAVTNLQGEAKEEVSHKNVTNWKANLCIIVTHVFIIKILINKLIIGEDQVSLNILKWLSMSPYLCHYFSWMQIAERNWYGLATTISSCHYEVKRTASIETAAVLSKDTEQRANVFSNERTQTSLLVYHSNESYGKKHLHWRGNISVLPNKVVLCELHHRSKPSGPWSDI